MSMTRVILVYGCIAGIVLVASLGVAVVIGQSHDIAGMAFGYLTMLIALSMVFVGVKRYRDDQLGGVIRFGTAFLLGLGISLVASAFYVLGWEAYMASTDYSFAEKYAAAMLEAQREAGASAEEIAAARTQMDGFVSLYANPLYRMAMTFTELAPIALLVTLVSALLLRNPRFMAAGGGPS